MKKFPFYGSTLEFSDELIAYNNLRSNFVSIGTTHKSLMRKLIDGCLAKYREDGDYSSYFKNVIAYMDTIISVAVQFSIFTLMQYGIDTYDKERFIALFDNNEGDNLYQKFGVWQPVDNYATILISIEDYKKGIAASRQEERSSRGHYSAVFASSIRNAVSAEISAGVMNAGLGIVRGIADSIQDSSDSKSTRKKIDRIVYDESLQNQFVIAATIPYDLCFLKVAIILWDKGIMKCPFSDEHVEHHDEIISRIKNYAEFGDKDKTFELLKEYLQQYPYNSFIYKTVYQLHGDANKDLIRLSAYFDMQGDYLDELELDKEKRRQYAEHFSIQDEIKETEEKLAHYRKTYLT